MAAATNVAPMDDTQVNHGMLIRWVNDTDTTTYDSRADAEKCRAYYDSRQWTPAEVAKLKKQKQAATVINRIKPKMDALMGMEKAAKTTCKAYPKTPAHEKAADAATEAIRFVLNDNAFDQVRGAAWENLLIEGTCGAEIIVKPQPDGDYKVVINHLFWDRLIYDAHSRTKSFDPKTCRFLGQVIWMDYEEALQEYPDDADMLQTMTSGATVYEDQPRWMDNTRKRVKIVELYYKEKGKVYYACFTYGGYLKGGPKVSPYINEEGETEWPYEFASAFVTREGARYGAVYQLLDVQDEINKRRSKALHLMSVRQIRLEKGAVDDVNKVRSELAKPDGVVETTPGMEFEVLKTGDMATAQFNLLEEAKHEIDAVGANAATQGKDRTVQSGVALRERAQMGQTEIGPMFDVLKYWQMRVFRKVWNRIHQYWKSEKWIRVTDDPNNLRWVGLNKPITKGEQILEQAQQQGIPPEQLQQLQAQIQANPEMQQVVDTKNDIVNLDVDIILEEVPEAANMQVETFQALAEMVKSGLPIPPEEVIAASSLPNKDRILKAMKNANQVPPQVQEQMKKMQEEAQKLAEENQALKQDQSVEKARLAADAQIAQQKAMMEQESLKLKAQLQIAELELEKQKIEAEITLARQKAEAEFALKQQCAEHDQRQMMQKSEFDMQQKRAADPAFAESLDMPRTADMLGQMLEQFQGIGAALQQIAELSSQGLALQEQTIAAIQAPKTVSIGGVARDANGAIVGANVATRTLQ